MRQRDRQVAVTEKVRNVLFVLAGVAALVLKRFYAGPSAETVHSYGGNVAASFAVYFLAVIAATRLRFGRLVAAAIALLAVETFEATNGFWVMSNVYDSLDFAANAAGVGFALAMDLMSSQLVAHRSGQTRSDDAGTPAA